MTDGFGKFLDRADTLLGALESRLNLIAGLIVFALMFLGVVQIVLRTVFRQPIFGYIDIVEIAMVGFAVLAISYVQRVGGHVRMELLVARLTGRVHWIAEAVSTLLGIFIVGVLIPYSYFHFERAFNIGDSTIDIEIATWPAKLIVPVALSVLMIRLWIQFGGYIRLSANPALEPVAVPLLKDVEEIAEEEIRQAAEDV
ncbi:MAG: TRAP transporter small permease subunit [Alphaproteobacteria bacterium]|jgi:TRAP-type C4-dicarboxylate transport system permease small subunit|nr:TRAP transporter small permease [Alphaproteobacteria bacterium]